MELSDDWCCFVFEAGLSRYCCRSWLHTHELAGTYLIVKAELVHAPENTEGLGMPLMSMCSMAMCLLVHVLNR